MEQCKLCLRKASQLEGSHFLSAGIYRTLRDETEKNPNPWLLPPTTAVQTSRQRRPGCFAGTVNSVFPN
jgi:hypothetical protein